MTDTKKPPTTVAQDVSAFRAVLDGQHAQTESAAEVLAEIAERYSGNAHLMHYHARLSRSLAAGKAVGVVEFDPRPADIAPQAWSERRVNWEDYDALPVGAKLYLAPPADPAKSSAPEYVRIQIAEHDERSDKRDRVDAMRRALLSAAPASEAGKAYAYAVRLPDGAVHLTQAHSVAETMQEVLPGCVVLPLGVIDHPAPPPAEADIRYGVDYGRPGGDKTVRVAIENGCVTSIEEQEPGDGGREEMAHLCERGLARSWRDCPDHNGGREGVEALTRLIDDDAYACTFQTRGQYRSALLREARRLASAPQPTQRGGEGA